MHNIETKRNVLENRSGHFAVSYILPKKVSYFTKNIRLFIVLSGLLLLIIVIYFYTVPVPYYRSPLDASTAIAGTFGEVRKDHFHLGLDIRTGGKENLPVYSMSDGFIYRASIQPDGYGKALYIAYGNGMMSLYGHMNAFSPEVEAAILKQQHLSAKWAQEMFFAAGRFPVKKGMIVGYSGNTGSSEGPHLHVELRNRNTKSIINPAVKGISIPDNHPPSITRIFVYNGSRSLYEGRCREINSTTNKGRKQIYNTITEVSDSLIRIGVEASDKNNHPKFRLGIYHAQLFLDGRLQFEFKMDSIPFAKERYVNATIDYSEWIQNKRSIQLLSALPGNHLPDYQRHSGKGILHLSDGRVHRVKIVVKDAAGNNTSVNFPIQYKPGRKVESRSSAKLLMPGVAHKVTTRNAVVYFSPLAFYDTVPFRMKESVSMTAIAASNLITVHDPSVPVHTRFRIQLKTKLPKNDPSRKYVLMELTSGKEKHYVKGEWKGDYMDGTFDRFGKVRLIVDRVSPVIKLESNTKGFSNGDILRLQYLDNCGSVGSFIATIDGNWVPFEQKKTVFQYRISKELSKGNHRLEVEVTDMAGNKKREIIDFKIQ